MDVLLHIEIFESFLKDNIFREDTDLLIYNIFNNPNTKIVFNNQIKNYLLENYGDNPKRKLFIESEFTKLVTNNRIVRQITESLLPDWNDNFIELNTNYKGNNLFRVIINANVKLNSISNLIVLNTRNKCNIHWIKSHILAYNTLTVRYFDFQNQNEVNQFFTDILSISTTINKLMLFDRYIIQNIASHNNFNALTGKNIPVDIYSYGMTASDIRSKRIAIETIFGRLGITVFCHNARHKDFIHERKLILDYFVIEADEDFSQIQYGRETWKISLTFSPQIVTKIQAKVNVTGNFTRII